MLGYWSDFFHFMAYTINLIWWFEFIVFKKIKRGYVQMLWFNFKKGNKCKEFFL